MFALFVPSCFQPVVNVNDNRDWDSIVRTEIKPGDDLNKVKTFLDQQGFDYSWNKSGHSYEAMKRDVKQQGFIITSISVEIRFDAEEKVSEIKVRPVLTGP